MLFPPVSDASAMASEGYVKLETGYTYSPDFKCRVHCLTHMPGVTPDMWDWWFGWHGCDGRRYQAMEPADQPPAPLCLNRLAPASAISKQSRR
ncbi:MAG: hypothetical protein AAF636_21880, partial [Pseudomonadota bacterium]